MLLFIWQVQIKGSSFARAAGSSDKTMMVLGYFFADIQADTRTFIFFFMQSLKYLKYALSVGRFEADTTI